MSPKIYTDVSPFDEVIKDNAKVDKRGRIALGSIATAKNYRIMTNHLGQILLDPVITIPEREMWLWKNQAAREQLERGLEQAAKGELSDLGSFTEYADEEIED